MYLSHPVRRMRDEPQAGETVSLVVTAEADDGPQIDQLAAAIAGTGATVEKRLQFGSLQVEISQDAIDDLCDLDGIESVETANTVGVGGDAGEDIGSE